MDITCVGLQLRTKQALFGQATMHAPQPWQSAGLTNATGRTGCRERAP
jgi:hypothetical protein